MNKLFCRGFQSAMKGSMYLLPWKTPETLEGAGCIAKLPSVIKSRGIDKVLIVTGPNIFKRGLLDSMLAAMEDVNLEYSVYNDIHGDPTDLNVAEGLKIYKENKCQAFIAFGGGAPMDCCKAIAAMAVKKKAKNATELQGLFKVLHPVPPIFAVPTTAGTGSETTIAAVITDSATHHKAAINDLSIMPTMAVLDPVLTVALPPHTTATTGMDALCHAVEAYTNDSYNSKLEKKLAEDAVKLIHDNLYKAYLDGSDLTARQNMQKAAFYAGRAFTRGSVGYVHAIGHTLGGLYSTPHGLAMAVILPHVMKQFGSAAAERLARLAEVCGMTGANDSEKAGKFITWIEQVNKDMGLPMHFDYIKDEDLPQIISWAMSESHPLYPVPALWDKNDFKKCINSIRGK